MRQGEAGGASVPMISSSKLSLRVVNIFQVSDELYRLAALTAATRRRSVFEGSGAGRHHGGECRWSAVRDL